MRGHPDSCGVWAPCLSYDNGTFYLVYSNVKTFDGPWLDSPNYLVITDDILGHWSDPIFLSSSGFDGSLFHDDDGRKWYTSMLHDHREGRFFGGIILQEYDHTSHRLVGPVHKIFEGTELGSTEGPHLYKRNGYYYLVTAEGGTEYNHAVTIARSRNIEGPYEVHPDNPIISSAQSPNHPLQKAGHADLVETPQGDWYAVFLVGRPLSERGKCILGRETAIEPMVWKDDQWLYTSSGRPTPSSSSDSHPLSFEHDDFDGSISRHFQTLREPAFSAWLDIKSRPGFLRIRGRESLSSLFSQSLLARRVQHFNVVATTVLEFVPTSFQQMAGLVFYYNTEHFHYLHVTADEQGNRILGLITVDKHEYKEYEALPVSSGSILLRGNLKGEELQFQYSQDGDAWHAVGPTVDAGILSDDYVRDGHIYRPAFTGAFVGICCQDLTGQGHHADFDWFHYEEHE